MVNLPVRTYNCHGTRGRFIFLSPVLDRKSIETQPVRLVKGSFVPGTMSANLQTNLQTIQLNDYITGTHLSSVKD